MTNLRSILIYALLTVSVGAVASIAVAAVSISGLAFWLWPTAKRIDAASVPLLQCTYYDAKAKIWRGNGNCLPSAIQAITGSTRKGMGEIAKAMPEIAASAKASAKKSVEASDEMIKLLKKGRDVLTEAQAAIHDLRSAKDSLDELRKILVHVNGTTLPAVDAALKPLGEDLQKVGTLLDDLHERLKTDGRVDQIIADLDTAVQTLNARLADPNIADALKHVDGGAANLERLIGYIADAFAPTKQSFWKALGLKLIPLGLGHLVPQRVSIVNEPTVQTK